MIVPLRIGSGIRAKILEAFSYGIPVISSSIGIEGIPAINGRHYLKADTSRDYIFAINELFNKVGFPDYLTKNARTEIIPSYDLDRCGDIRLSLYRSMEMESKQIEV